MPPFVLSHPGPARDFLHASAAAGAQAGAGIDATNAGAGGLHDRDRSGDAARVSSHANAQM